MDPENIERGGSNNIKYQTERRSAIFSWHNRAKRWERRVPPPTLLIRAWCIHIILISNIILKQPNIHLMKIYKVRIILML